MCLKWIDRKIHIYKWGKPKQKLNWSLWLNILNMPKAPFFCLTWMTKQLKFKHLFIFILKVNSIEKYKGWNFILICLYFGACAVNLNSWNNIRLFMLTYFLHYALFCHLKNNAEIKWLGLSYYILEVLKE